MDIYKITKDGYLGFGNMIQGIQVQKTRKYEGSMIFLLALNQRRKLASQSRLA